MFNPAYFTAAMTDYVNATHGTLDIRFNKNSDLAVIVEKIKLLSGVDFTGLTPETAPAKFAAAFHDGLEKLDEGSKKILSDCIHLFADRIKTSLDLLKTIGDTAMTLETEIERDRNTYLSVHPYPSIHLKRQAEDLGITYMPWDDINIIGSEHSIVEKFHAKDNINDAASRVTMNIVRNKLPMVVDQNCFGDLKLTEDSYNKCLEALNSLFSQRAGVTDVPAVLATITSANASKNFARQITNIADTVSGHDADNCVELLAIIRNYGPVVEGLKQGIIELSDEHQTILEKNLETMMTYLEYAAYYIHVCRRSIYADTIMLPNEMINKDAQDDFISKGGTMLMVYHHRYYVYQDSKIPNAGISASSVLDRADQIVQRVTEDVRNIDTRIAAISNEAKRTSFRSVVERYAVKAIQNDPEHGAHFADYKHLLDKYATTYVSIGASLTDCLYGFIIDHQYRDTFASVLYEQLGAAYTRNLKAATELTEEDTNLIETGVFSSLVSQFLVEKFVK